jgi:DNA polymerase III epsilon subunit-like protein
MYLFFDTETTGLPKKWHAPVTDIDNWPRLVQIAWVLSDIDGRELAKHESIIKPEGFLIPEKSSEVHGITTEIAEAMGIDLKTALDQFVWALKQAKYLVAHNIKFDEKIIGAEFIRKAFNHNILNIDKICTMQSATDYCQLPGRYGYKWPKLSELHQKLFDKDFDNAHNALADVEAMVKCFFEMKSRGILK